MDKPAIEDLIGQLDGLRRERRQILGAAAVLLVAGLVMVAAGAGFIRKSRVVEAEQILLRDPQGRVRARLGTASDGSPAFSLIDGRGRDVVTLHGSGNESAVLSLMNRGRTRVALAATADGAVTLNFFDGHNRSATGMYLWKDGTAGIGLRNPESEVQIAARTDGRAGLTVTGKDGREQGQLGSLKPEPAPNKRGAVASGAGGPRGPAPVAAPAEPGVGALSQFGAAPRGTFSLATPVTQ